MILSEHLLVNIWRLDLEDKEDMGWSVRGYTAMQEGCWWFGLRWGQQRQGEVATCANGLSSQPS